jgi:hypothetical protein
LTPVLALELLKAWVDHTSYISPVKVVMVIAVMPVLSANRAINSRPMAIIVQSVALEDSVLLETSALSVSQVRMQILPVPYSVNLAVQGISKIKMRNRDAWHVRRVLFNLQKGKRYACNVKAAPHLELALLNATWKKKAMLPLLPLPVRWVLVNIVSNLDFALPAMSVNVQRIRKMPHVSNTMQYSTLHYNTTQYNTIQCNIIMIRIFVFALLGIPVNVQTIRRRRHVSYTVHPNI